MEDRSDAPRPSPKILVVSALPFMFSARLVLGLRQVGFAVAVVCPTDQHPVHLLRHPPTRFALGFAGANSLGPFGARARVIGAIERFQPDMIIPCDDYAAQIIHRIARSAPAAIVDLLERSLGPIEAYPVLESRTAQVSLASQKNIRTPRFRIIADETALTDALRDIGLPAFMKRDDSWAGQGVRKIGEIADLDGAWHELANRHSLAHAAKNLRAMGMRHAAAGIRRVRPAIHLQAAIAGRPAHRTVLCRNGDVIAGFSLIAVQTSTETGPASVVRVTDNPEMSAAAAVLTKELRLNGLAGCDFIVADGGAAYFLEINARATPAANLSVAGSPDLLGLLYQMLTASSHAPARSGGAETIALFPDELLRDETSPFLETGHHDVPSDEPGLVEFGLRQVRHKLAQSGRPNGVGAPSPARGS